MIVTRNYEYYEMAVSPFGETPGVCKISYYNTDLRILLSSSIKVICFYKRDMNSSNVNFVAKDFLLTNA